MKTNFSQFGTLLTREESKKIKGRGAESAKNCLLFCRPYYHAAEIDDCPIPEVVEQICGPNFMDVKCICGE